MSRADLIALAAKAMRNSKAWPVVFHPGSAEELIEAALKAWEKAGIVLVAGEPE